MTTPTPEQQREERLDKLRAALHAEPERMAGFTDRHAELSRLIARLQVKLELGDDVRAQLTAAMEERSDLAVDISLNGRRAQALQAELSEAEAQVAHAQARAAAEARARWEPPLRAKLPELERNAVQAVNALIAARSLLDVTPAGQIDPSVLIKKLTYYEGTAAIERIKLEFMAQGEQPREQARRAREREARERVQQQEREQAQERARQQAQQDEQRRKARRVPGEFEDGPMPGP